MANWQARHVCSPSAKNEASRMPSFFGYMRWSGGILLPLFVVITVIFFS
nr:sodium:proton antiporter [Bradyrhizobium frederickii]